MRAQDIIQKYITFFEKRGHTQISNASLVPENDPTTLFTSSGMQPLVPYLLGEKHPSGKRLVNVQNSFRAQDIDEIGDNRHTTFFRMLGNWSLGDYFKQEQLPWFFEFLIDPKEGLGLDPHRLYVTVFEGDKSIPKDTESIDIWKTLFQSVGIDARVGERIFAYDVEENWWSRAGPPDNMPKGEPGGPDSEVFFDFYPEQGSLGGDLKKYSHNGRLLEIGNSVFMQYKKTAAGFDELPQKNVDFGAGLERLLAAAEDTQDMFQTDLFQPIIQSIERESEKNYYESEHEMRIVADHFVGASFIISSGIFPSNKEQGYILRRLIRRGMDNAYALGIKNLEPILESITSQYGKTDAVLIEKFEQNKNTLLEEREKYEKATGEAKKFIEKKYDTTDELKGVSGISAEDAFLLYTTHGLSPSQIKSLGYTFNDQEFARLMEEHQKVSKKGASKKFAGGLADHSKFTIKGHTATHLLHQAIRDLLGSHVHQSGSNITPERVRFDYNFDRKLTGDEIKQIEDIVNKKIKEDLPVHYELMPFDQAKKIGAIGLFDDKYQENVKVYFIGDYSKEFCGGPHVEFTGEIKSFKIIKEEGLGKGFRRIYAKIE